jgi:hypothetical protein
MEILGHSQISVTMSTYSDVTPASSREAVARVEGLLFVEQFGAVHPQLA